MKTQPEDPGALPAGGTVDGAAELLRTALDAVSDSVAVLDAQGLIVLVNAAWRQSALALGALAGQAAPQTGIGTNYLAITTQGDPQAADGIRAVLSGAADSFSLQYPCHTPGCKRWFKMRVTPLSWNQQRGAIVAHADVTPQGLVEEALHQGELRFRTLFDKVEHVAIQGYAPDGTTRYWNAAAEQLYGYNASEALGANLLELIIPPDMRPDVRQAVAEMTRTGTPIAPGELTLMRKDGSPVSVLSSHALVKNSEGVNELFCVDIDLSARMRAEDALRESEQRFSSIANATPVMIWLAGTDTLCYWFNAGWLAFTGRTLAQEAGNGWAEGVHPDDFQRCVDHYLHHFEQRLPFQMEYRLKHHSGHYRWIHDSGVPRFDASGVFLGYIGSCVDSHKVHTANERLAALTAVMPGVVYQFVSQPDGQGAFLYLSQGMDKLYGISAEAASRDPELMTRCILPDDRAAHSASVAQAIHSQSQWLHEHRIAMPTGEHKWIRSQAMPQLQPDGSLLWSGLLTDVTAQKELEQRLRQGANVFAYVQEAIVITDAQGGIIDVNAAFTRTTGYERDEVLGQNPRLLSSGQHSAEFFRAMWRDIHAQGFWMGEVFNRHKSGQVYAVILNVSAVTNEAGQVTHYVGVTTDITQLKTQQALLERVAHYDALTQLPNRVLLADRLQQLIAQAQRNQAKVAVCYLDLDGFKQVNDTLGHDAGDTVLQTVAQRITGVLRGSDTAARIGGDEFVVLLSDLDSFENVNPLLQRLLLAIGQPMDLHGQRAQVGASIGVSLYPDTASEPDTLLRQADVAMYQAKEAGKNCYRFSGAR